MLTKEGLHDVFFHSTWSLVGCEPEGTVGGLTHGQQTAERD